MKKRNNNKIIFLLAGLSFLSWMFASAQDAAPEILLDLKYNVSNNQVPYILVHSKTKLEKKKFQPVAGITVSIYLDKQSTDALLGKLITNDKGDGAVFLSSSLKAAWDSSGSHTFLAFSETKKPYAETTAELKITKARILLDTLLEDTVRNVVIKVEEHNNGKWVPVKGVELKAAVKRLGGDLNISDEASFTTDSLGLVKAEFKRNSLPGDEKGNIILIAKVEDNETFGNLSIEKTVRWGAPFKYESTFNERSLFATRDKTPFWLLFLAYTIIGIVWGTMIYLVIQIFKIRKLGKEAV